MDIYDTLVDVLKEFKAQFRYEKFTQYHHNVYDSECSTILIINSKVCEIHKTSYGAVVFLFKRETIEEFKAINKNFSPQLKVQFKSWLESRIPHIPHNIHSVLYDEIVKIIYNSTPNKYELEIDETYRNQDLYSKIQFNTETTSFKIGRAHV